MRQYYLCNPDDQAITGPHPFAELIEKAQQGGITPEWFVAEPGSEKFTPFSESFALHEILFKGGAVPVDPPPVSSFKVRGGPAKVESCEESHPQDLTNHQAEFAKVIEVSQLSTKPKPRPAPVKKPAPEKTPPEPMPQGELNPETILQAARDDFSRVLKKHDDDHFNPPTYWESSAGERMKAFLYGEALISAFCGLILVVFWFMGAMHPLPLIYLLSFYTLLSGGLACIVFFLMS